MLNLQITFVTGSQFDGEMLRKLYKKSFYFIAEILMQKNWNKSLDQWLLIAYNIAGFQFRLVLHKISSSAPLLTQSPKLFVLFLCANQFNTKERKKAFGNKNLSRGHCFGLGRTN